MGNCWESLLDIYDTRDIDIVSSMPFCEVFTEEFDRKSIIVQNTHYI